MQSELFICLDWCLCHAETTQQNQRKVVQWQIGCIWWPMAIVFVSGVWLWSRNGLFKSTLLIFISNSLPTPSLFYLYSKLCQAYKHIFAFPSSVDKELKATRSSNAYIHRMSKVTLALIAYVATQVHAVQYFDITMRIFWPLTDLNQVWFSLSSSLIFSRTNTLTDSERFYNSVVELFPDPEEKKEVNELLIWWNWCICIIYIQRHFTLTGVTLMYICSIFPNQLVKHPVYENSALAKIKQKWAEKRALEAQGKIWSGVYIYKFANINNVIMSLTKYI